MQLTGSALASTADDGVGAPDGRAAGRPAQFISGRWAEPTALAAEGRMASSENLQSLALREGWRQCGARRRVGAPRFAFSSLAGR